MSIYYCQLLSAAAEPITGAYYEPDNTNPGARYDLTLLDSVDATDTNHVNGSIAKLLVYRLPGAVASTAHSPTIVAQFDGAVGGAGYAYWVVRGSHSRVVTASGFGTSSSVDPQAGPSDVVLDAMGWRMWSSSGTSVAETPVPESGQEADWVVSQNNPTGQEDLTWGGGHKVGTGTREWSWTSERYWVAAAIVIPPTPGVTASGGTAPLEEA